MLTLEFDNYVVRAPSHVGPAPCFRLRGDTLYEGANGQAVAHLNSDGCWETPAWLYTVVRFPKQVKIHFEAEDGSRTEELGPFEQVSVRDGAIWLRPKINKRLAWLDPGTRRWHVARDGKEYATAVIEGV